MPSQGQRLARGEDWKGLPWKGMAQRAWVGKPPMFVPGHLEEALGGTVLQGLPPGAL